MTHRNRHSDKINLFEVLILITSIIIIVTWAASSPIFESSRTALRTTSVPAALLNYGEMGKILKRNTLITSIHNDNPRYLRKKEEKITDEDLTSYNLFQKKRQVGNYLYQARTNNNRYQENAHSSKYDYLADTPVVSLTLDPDFLFDPEIGILSHSNLKGRDWERPSVLTVSHGINKETNHNVGVRIHGPKHYRNRFKGGSNQGYEIIFKSKYGVRQIPISTIFSDSVEKPLTGVILEQGNVLKKSLALDLAQRMGLSVPFHQPVIFQVNSESLGIRLAREPITLDQWKTKSDDTAIDFYNSNVGQSDPGWRWHLQLHGWINSHPDLYNMKVVSSSMDVEKLTNTMIFHMFCGSSDWQNWAIFKPTHKEHPWEWISWDMSHCFSDRWKTSPGPLWKQHWYQVVATLDSESKQWGTPFRNIKPSVFVGLMNYDPEYPRYFLEKLKEFLKNGLDIEYLNTRLEYYRSLAQYEKKNNQFEDSVSIDELGDFISNRAQFIESELSKLDILP